MTRVHINGCLEEGCTRPGGHSLLCDDHAPNYEPAIAMETGTGETRTRLDPKDNSAGRDGIAGKDIA